MNVSPHSMARRSCRTGGSRHPHHACKQADGTGIWSAPAERSDDGAFIPTEPSLYECPFPQKAASRCACRRSPKNRARAFTFVELAALLAVLALLAMVILPALAGPRQRSERVTFA